jgi:amino-acid N-acetyltransferase
MTWTIESATRADREAIERLLMESGLPTEDLTGAWHENFRVARDGEAVVGAIGLEPYGAIALVRSLAVALTLRKRGIASALLAKLEERAAALGVGSVYGLTTTAKAFLAKRGYETIDRTSLPSAIRATAEFRELCPVTAVCLRKGIA